MSFNLAFYGSLLLIIVLFFLPLVGIGVGLEVVFGIIIPYVSLLIFLAGIVSRVITWARTPVPYRIPTTAGQQRSLPWIRSDNLENPHNLAGVIGRMILEVLLFRSLFRNLRSQSIEESGSPEGRRLIYWSSKWLWLGAIAFHYSFLIILLRHLRFFTEPVLSFVNLMANIDSFFQVYVPALYISSIVFLLAAIYLLLRRVFDHKIGYISLASDYFPLFLILGIGISGVFMRYFYRVDVVAVKELAMGLVTFHPTIPAESIGSLFYIHLFFVCALLAYFPFSKLIHMAGIFFSMTRNMANNNRAVRHTNPWEYPVKIFSYMQQEDMFRREMKAAGIPLEKDIEE
jgi:nitrate reductase gamma subunit